MKKNGEVSDFLTLYQQVYADLYHFALYLLKNQQAAYEQFGQLRSRKAFKSWIFKILTNKCNQKMRAYYQQTTPLEQANLWHSPDLAGDASVRSAFSQLKEEEQLIVALNVFGGYKEKEIAGMLNQNYSTVRSKYYRALQKMRASLE